MWFSGLLVVWVEKNQPDAHFLCLPRWERFLFTRATVSSELELEEMNESAGAAQERKTDMQNKKHSKDYLFKKFSTVALKGAYWFSVSAHADSNWGER